MILMYMHHQFFFGFVIIMLMRSNPDAIRINIFVDAYVVRNIFVDVNADNIFLLLTLTPQSTSLTRTSVLLYPRKKIAYLQLCGGDENRQLLVRFNRRCTSEHTVKKVWFAHSV